jgi:hypothetical protein
MKVKGHCLETMAGKLRKIWNRAYYRRLLKVVRRHRPDIIHDAITNLYNNPAMPNEMGEQGLCPCA